MKGSKVKSGGRSLQAEGRAFGKILGTQELETFQEQKRGVSGQNRVMVLKILSNGAGEENWSEIPEDVWIYL